MLRTRRFLWLILTGFAISAPIGCSAASSVDPQTLATVQALQTQVAAKGSAQVIPTTAAVAPPTQTATSAPPSPAPNAAPSATAPSAPPPSATRPPAAAPSSTSLAAPNPTAAKNTGGAGHVTYRGPQDHIYRIQAREGAVAEDISVALDKLSPRQQDAWLNLSPNGQWLLLETGRFSAECAGWACLAIVKGDLSSGAAVQGGGQLIHPDGFGAVASSGNVIVFPGAGGTHSMDLWGLTRSGAAWSAPVELTRNSTYPYNSQPAISPDGTQVLFDCGSQPYGGEGTAICQVGVDGSGLRVAISPDPRPTGAQNPGTLHHAAFAPGGGIVFESDWNAEQIWRLPAPATAPLQVGKQFTNDNSPCVLPDGRIISLWLDRPGASGVHEMKVMAADGSSYAMVLTNTDVADVGIGCGE